MARVPVTGSTASQSGIQNASYTYAADAEASDAYAITLSPAVAAYAAGQEFAFKANTANTGAASLNVNSLGAKTLKKNTDQDLATGDIEAGSIVKVVYDGTNFQVVSVDANLNLDEIAAGSTNVHLTTTLKTKLDGIETLADVTDAGNVGSAISGATAKTTPVGGDSLGLIDSAASNVLKNLTLTNLLSWLSSATQTLTNKTIDANGTGNAISNLEIADFTAAAIVTAADTIASNDNDTTVPTSAAVIDYVAANAGGVASGVIAAFGAAAAPTGWLLCDGTAVSRTTYAALFTAIGTNYGVGDGSTTFNVPNLKGRIPVGLDSAQTEFDALAETGGAKTHTLVSGEMPAHTHTATSYEQGTVGDANTFGWGENSSTSSAGATTASTGGGGAHNNLQPYIVVNYIIKT